ncbi:threonine dehydratase [Rhizobiales bacterium GAS191]|nr:threonine dehydratase [Rhizobiales bacterium GAS191]
MMTLGEIEEAARLVHRHMPATPQYIWPLLGARFGAEIVVKHENHTPVGAFKLRGGIVYVERLKRERPQVKGIVSATRGNHGQSLALAGRLFGVPVAIVVPHGNSVEKNAAMRALGAELIETGSDFDDAKEAAGKLAAERGFEFVPSFAPDLVKGVATYALELFGAHGDIDTLYAPIGLGSGICGLIAVRDAMGLKTRIVGVVPERANAYRLSFDAGRVVPVNSLSTFADGVAVRVPDAQALALIRKGAERVVEVSEDEIAEAIRVLHEDTHNMAEGAGAAALAALAKDARAQKDAGRRKDAKLAVILSGGNIDRALAAKVLAGGTPG